MKNLKKKWMIASMLVLLLCPGWFSLVHAQESQPALAIRLDKNFGYNGFGGDIQGSFTLKVKGPEELARVEYFIDGNSMGVVDETPFSLTFSTDAYALGIHRITAVGYGENGERYASNEMRTEFVSASDGLKSVGAILVPLFGLIVVITMISAFLSSLPNRGKKPARKAGQPASYGLYGGAVCPRCGSPFGRHWWAPHAGGLRFDRCPHCGGWSLVGRSSAADLQAAEARMAENEILPEVSPEAAEAAFKRSLDDSHYLDE